MIPIVHAAERLAYGLIAAWVLWVMIDFWRFCQWAHRRQRRLAAFVARHPGCSASGAELRALLEELKRDPEPGRRKPAK